VIHFENLGNNAINGVSEKLEMGDYWHELMVLLKCHPTGFCINSL
jgi:hypothetical protein